jgi:hypothetical protein
VGGGVQEKISQQDGVLRVRVIPLEIHGRRDDA